ncbi:kinase-like domain-containing protein, partial [Blyttiomyces helicus]
VDQKITDLLSKVAIERKVRDGARAMLDKLKDQNARQQCEMNAVESDRRLEFLEGELRKLQLRKWSTGAGSSAPVDSSSADPMAPLYGSRSSSLEGDLAGAGTRTPPARSTSGSNIFGNLLGTITGRGNAPSAGQSPRSSSVSTTGSQPTLTNYLRFTTQLTTEKIKYRIREVRHKLDLEQKVKSGTENLVTAMTGGHSTPDPKTMQELEEKLAEANAKVCFLAKAEHRYATLSVDDDESGDLYMIDPGQRRTGRLKISLLGATNLPGRRSSKDEIVAIVRIDGVVQYTTRPTKHRWDESHELQVDKAQEVEVAVYEKTGLLLALSWFRLWELEEDLKLKYPAGHENADIPETWLDMEPGGQLLLKINFTPMTRTKTERDRVFRRNPVQKVYPRNGHKFIAQQFYQVVTCALCGDFLGRQGYNCQGCNYTVHAKCYNRVITKCITKETLHKGDDPNTGQLLKYKIPHRWEQSTNLGAAWCSHCGHILPIGRKIHRCTECNKAAHKECSHMVPYFCGLAPEMADTLVAAFEDHEKRMHQKEMEEAERARKASQAPATVATAPLAQQPGPPSPRKESMGQVEDAMSPRPSPVGDGSGPLPSSAIQVKKPMVVPSDVPVPKPTLPAPPAREKPRPLRLPPTDVVISDFDFFAVLGRGAFGKVMLAGEKSTGMLYAIKAIKKDFIIQNDEIKSTRLEKRIFQAASAANHPYLVNLHSCFQNDTRIYFVMQYVSGGDLMAHILSQKRFPISRVKFYACEVLLALEYFHKTKIIYRDLKLENILMSSDGHLKVADYGICKEDMPYGQTTRTFCGTPDYMAPEILMASKYNRAVDWWSFGVLIYVMIFGRYPFQGENYTDILDHILSNNLSYPSNLPAPALSLLQGLLTVNPLKRLGGGVDDAAEIKRHPFFDGVDWNAFMEKRVAPPWVPQIVGIIGLSGGALRDDCLLRIRFLTFFHFGPPPP